MDLGGVSLGGGFSRFRVQAAMGDTRSRNLSSNTPIDSGLTVQGVGCRV